MDLKDNRILARNNRSVLLLIISVGLGLCFLTPGLSQNNVWKKVDVGLFWAEFDPAPQPSATVSKVVVLKIDPRYYAFKLLCASEHERERLTARAWCEKKNLVAAINAGMYQEDGFTNVGYMKNLGHVNNPRLNTTYQAVVAFNRNDATVPEVQIIDLKCQNFEELKGKYQTFIQNIRMISCKQENVWSKQDKRWSLAVLGMDKSGHVLFIFSEEPYSGYDFNHFLLSLPISIFNATYLEGGPQASLYLSANDIQLDYVGIHGVGLDGDRVRAIPRLLPNVIGITRKF
jgi:hypothetical protein